MLTNTEITSILPVKDIERARDFYQTKLELVPDGYHADGSFVFKCGNAKISLIHKSEGTKAEHTALSFEVEDVKSEVHNLESRGVHFEDYDLPQLRTEDHIAVIGDDRCAWFKDTEGNILCLHQGIKH